jgi:hypothetical protein
MSSRVPLYTVMHACDGVKFNHGCEWFHFLYIILKLSQLCTQNQRAISKNFILLPLTQQEKPINNLCKPLTVPITLLNNRLFNYKHGDSLINNLVIGAKSSLLTICMMPDFAIEYTVQNEQRDYITFFV